MNRWGPPTVWEKVTAALDVFGNGALGVFVLSVPVFYLNTSLGMAWLVQPLGLLAVVANLPKLSLNHCHRSMLFLAALWMFFACTAFDTGQAYVTDYFTVYGKFTLLALVLSFEVRTRPQLSVVMGALAISTIVVAVLSRSQLSEARLLLGEVDSSRMYAARTAGVFANANLMGTYAIVAAMAALILVACTGPVVFWSVCLPSIVGAAYLARYSGSRKAILGMALVCGFAVWESIRLKGVKARSGMSILIVLGVLVAGALWLRTNPFTSRFNTEEQSYVERSELIQSAWNMWQKAPIAGLGYRAFELKEASGAYTHSTPMEMLVNGGAVAFGLYLAFWWSLYRSVKTCLAVEHRARERVVLAGLGWLGGVLFVFGLFTVITEEVLFLTLCGCVCGILRQKELESLPRRQPQRG